MMVLTGVLYRRLSQTSHVTRTPGGPPPLPVLRLFPSLSLNGKLIVQ